MSISRTSFLRALAASSALVSTAAGFAIPASVYQAREITHESQLRADGYDYIIVGGGTAGLTVADRLTEDPKTTVLVLESGNFPRDTVLPVSGSNTAEERMSLTSVPQVNLNGRTQAVTIGHTVGGSSAVNAMIAMRGSAEDYNRWGSLFEKDEQGWNWEGILPYFKKGVQLNPPPAELAARFNITWDTSYWGTDSPIQASFPAFQYPGLDPLVSAFFELPNVEMTKDSGAGGAGVYWFPTLMDPVKKERSFAYNEHYKDFKNKRHNYHVWANTPARRIVLEGTKATGVEFRKASEMVVIPARKEVILSAGAIHTPKLLQVSGIGPENLLKEAGIETVVNLPGVGQNFQDHASIGAAISLPGLAEIHPNPNDFAQVNSTFRQWAEEVWAANRTGPRSIGFGNIAGWLPLTAITPDRFDALASELEAQDHASFLPEGTDPTVAKGYAAQMLDLAHAMRSKDTVWSRYHVDAVRGATRPILNQMFSRGSVNINTADPFNSPPIVDYRALSNPMEVKVSVEMVKWYRRYNFETSLKAFGPVETAPGAAVTSDEDLATWLKTAYNPSDYHPSGTAAMMPKELGGVVDQTMRVYGVQSLRVVDASIMPVLPGANTCQPTYGMAEKAADIIKATRA